jgi:NitT/TauT family transport system substrate-binding protein
MMRLGVTLFCLLVTFSATVGAQEQRLQRINFSYPSLTKTRVALWIAKDSGLFEKYGVNVNLIVIRSGNTSVSALITGDIDVLGGPASTSMLATEAGLPVVIIGTFGPASRKLVVPPRIQSAEDLRGKTIGVSNFGTIIDYSVRRALPKLGLTPKDVNIIPTGLSQPVQRMLLMFQGKIDATLASDDEIYAIEAMGHKVKVLAELRDLGVYSSYSDLSTTREFLKSRRGAAKSFLMGFSEAISVAKKNKDVAIRAFRKYLKAEDPKLLDLMYKEYVTEAAPLIPYPLTEAIRTDIEILSATRPGFKDKKPADFTDISLLKELESEGFFTRLNP